MHGRLATTVASLGALASTAGSATPADEAYRKAIAEWRAAREERLKADGGWLTVAGLFWLEEGRRTFGSDRSNDIVLPASAPARAGVFERAAGTVRVALEPGVAARMNGRALGGAASMAPDSSGRPDVLAIGRLSMTVIERGERLGIRLRDLDSPARRAFSGLEWFDVDEGWRVDARFVAYEKPRPVKVPNVLGHVTEMPSPGYAEFTRDGQTIRLEGVLEEAGADELFFIFRDGTSGDETYGAGRFLYAPLPRDGRIVLDFNKAYSPPCAFTPYATCPLPPRQNWMPIRVEAGEKAYGQHH